MRRFSFLTVLFVAVFAMVMSAPLIAQGMMKSGHNQQTTTSKKDAMWNDQYSMVQKIDDQSKTLDQDFQKLQSNFKSIMNMENMSGIKEGLQKQQQMMTNMEPMMKQQQNMSGKLMSVVDKRSESNTATAGEQKMAKNMSGQTQVMNEDFMSMQNDLKDMMKMNNMSDLKQAMQQHYMTMENMSQMMTGQQDMAGQMMSMMNGNNMGSGMMQKTQMGQSGMQKTGTDPNKTSTDSTKTKTGKW